MLKINVPEYMELLQGLEWGSQYILGEWCMRLEGRGVVCAPEVQLLQCKLHYTAKIQPPLHT